ncbi:hypothetical protein KM043_016018 [Ampulex compressa]|nr:hypothetical protein KM043_016018 [Ampulex compressa]
MKLRVRRNFFLKEIHEAQNLGFHSCTSVMAYLDKKHEYIGATLSHPNQVKIPEDQNMMETDLDILYTSCVDSTVNQEDIGRKVSAVKKLLEKDLRAADLKWSLFIAASNTYRYDTCLRPFPPMYIKNECKDIETLRRAIELIPPLPIILTALQDPDVYETYGIAIELLYWVLIRLRDPYMKSVNKECYDSVLSRVPSEMSVAAPNLIFQVASANQSVTEEKWKVIAQGHKTFYAYHGSRLENFHSIIHYGLQQNTCKTSIFGKGIYLSSELGVSLPYSRIGYSWGGSVLGSEMSCIALCEVVDHPDVKTGNSGDDVRSMVPDSEGGRVPKKHYLVTNSDLVRVRYLLIYSEELPPQRDADKTGLLTWFKRHKLLTFVLGYVVLLASVGLTHNKQVEKYYKLFVQKAGFE